MKKFILILCLPVLGCTSTSVINQPFIFNQISTVSSGNSILSKIYPKSYFSLDKDVIFTGHDNRSIFLETREKSEQSNSNKEKTFISTRMTLQPSESDSTISFLDYKIKIIKADGGNLYFKLIKESDQFKRTRIFDFFGYRSKLFRNDGSLIATGKVNDETEYYLVIALENNGSDLKVDKKEIHRILSSY